MAVRTWWREKRVCHDGALDIVHSLLSDDKIYVVTCAFSTRERKMFCLILIVVEGEIRIKSGVYVTSLDVERIYWRKIKENWALSCKTLKSIAQRQLFLQKIAINNGYVPVRVVKFLSRQLHAFCLRAFYQVFSCPFLILLELMFFFLLLFFPGERRFYETFLKLLFIFTGESMNLQPTIYIKKKATKIQKVLETNNVSTEISKAGPSVLKSTKSSSFNLSHLPKKLIRNTKILYTSFQCFSSINVTQHRQLILSHETKIYRAYTVRRL